MSIKIKQTEEQLKREEEKEKFNKSVETGTKVFKAIGGLTGNPLVSGAVGATAGVALGSVNKQTETGSMNANINQYSYPYPFIKITRRKTYNPNELARMEGIEANSFCVLGTLKGYTVVKDVHLKGIKATLPELDMIEEALKKGVYI